MGNVNKTEINKNFSVIEIQFNYDGQDHTSVYVFDKINNRRELIGTSFEGFEYSFNSKYVIFTSADGIEIVFDICAFEFITDEVEQMKSYQQMLNCGIEESTKEDKSIEQDHLILDLKKRLNKNSSF